jgi:hypothetical protein
MSIHTIVIYRNGAVHNGDTARGGKALPFFFSVITRSALSPES